MGAQLESVTAHLLVAIVLFGLAADDARAEKRASLIAIGTYRDRGIPVLDGPAYDLPAMKELLSKKLGFTDIRTLFDGQATRAAILSELAQLGARVRPGDYVVFYYSGHGTSYGDPAARTWGLDPNSGAILPWDIPLAAGPRRINADLIVGKRDMRPIFSAIDKVAILFAIMDTCYSADTAKSAVKRRSARYIPPSLLTGESNERATKRNDLDEDIVTMVNQQDRSAFPYRRAVLLSAAGKFQSAEDISSDDLRRNPSLSLDGKPHGYLTEAILRGMSGQADKNRDGVVSHEELYGYLQERAVRWSHQPVMQTAAVGSGALISPAFGMPAVPVVTPAPAGRRKAGRL